MKEANMKLLQNTLANLIRSGKVIVDIPGLDMDQLTQFLYSESVILPASPMMMICLPPTKSTSFKTGYLRFDGGFFTLIRLA